jgi:hypothetical protein
LSPLDVWNINVPTQSERTFFKPGVKLTPGSYHYVSKMTLLFVLGVFDISPSDVFGVFVSRTKVYETRLAIIGDRR